ncbi:MAG TPA: hypothetical protein VF909_21520 [Roseiflexaceae bacterium]|jgi:hypothetical protein
MNIDDRAFISGDDTGLALLEAELAALMSNLEQLKIALAELLAAMQLQCALERHAPEEGDQMVRWN